MSGHPPGYGGTPQDYPPQQPGAYPPAPGAPQGPPGTLVCPKCRGQMRTYERNGVHIEQCGSCRGIFLDFGELESLTRLEGQMAPQYAPPPPQSGHYGPGWGHRGGHYYRKKGLGSLFFSS